MSAARLKAEERRRPTVLIASGLDPTGQAGFTVDVATVTELGGRAVGALTAMTAQGAASFLSLSPPSRLLRLQLYAAKKSARVGAVKLGAVAGPGALEAVMDHLGGLRVPWVVDPVRITSRGELLSKLRRIDYLRMAQSWVVLTPNISELAWLLDEEEADGLEQAAAQGARLRERGFAAVVIKGGHLAGPATDILCAPDGVRRYSGKRLPGVSVKKRGKGCRFSSALAVHLAQGAALSEAVPQAKRMVRNYLLAV